MANRKPKDSPKGTSTDPSAAVDQFMQTLDHPFKAEIETLRKLIRSVSPTVAEGIKWNAPSFRTTEYFGTTHLRAKNGLGLILHLGAKARALPAGGVSIDDPKGILSWLGKDRAIIEFKSASELRDKSGAIAAVIKQWIRYV